MGERGKPLQAPGGWRGKGNPDPTSDQERRIVAARLGIRRFGSCCHSAAMGVLFVSGFAFLNSMELRFSFFVFLSNP